MNSKNTVVIFACLFLVAWANAQTIRMYFPHFAGKTYDFILFQGDKQVVLKDTIPPGGRFTLVVPKALRPYTGMSRWLLTNNQEGGGLDMIIPGRDFSVSCQDPHPSDSSIVYAGNAEVARLIALNRTQEQLLARYGVMQQALLSFSKSEASYPVFVKEAKRQGNLYADFQDGLDKDSGYAAKFLRIVNFTRGIGPGLDGTEYERVQGISRYIADRLDWEALFTSGHWTTIISSWIDMHTRVLKDPYGFAEDFAKIGSRITDPALYTDFAGRTAYFLTRQGRDDLIGSIAQTVVSSGKVDKYEGSLKVYTHGAVGTQAPDLVLSHGKDSVGVKIPDVVFKASEFCSGGYKKTMLVFYEAGCMGCEMLLKDLLPKYDSLKADGVRVIAVSADLDEASFKGRSKAFPWKDNYCDYAGMNGVNFKNYGVAGTPTVFWIAPDGRIEKREAGIREGNEGSKD
jgi:hypothetical protein